MLLSFPFAGGEAKAQRGEVTKSGSHLSKWHKAGPSACHTLYHWGSEEGLAFQTGPAFSSLGTLLLSTTPKHILSLPSVAPLS